MIVLLWRVLRKKKRPNTQDEIFYKNVDPLDATELNSILQNTSTEVLLREKEYAEIEYLYNPRDSGISMSGQASDCGSVSSHFRLLTTIMYDDLDNEETRLCALTPDGSTCYDEFVASLDMGPPLEEDGDAETSFGPLSILPPPTLAGSEFDLSELNDVIDCCNATLSESLHIPSRDNSQDDCVQSNNMKRSETVIWWYIVVLNWNAGAERHVLVL